LRLDSAGLTNNPNLKGLSPLSNRRAEVTPEPQKTRRHETHRDTSRLGREASEDAICAEITKIKTAPPPPKRLDPGQPSRSASQERVTELESQLQTLTESVVEADLNK